MGEENSPSLVRLDDRTLSRRLRAENRRLIQAWDELRAHGEVASDRATTKAAQDVLEVSIELSRIAGDIEVLEPGGVDLRQGAGDHP